MQCPTKKEYRVTMTSSKQTETYKELIARQLELDYMNLKSLTTKIQLLGHWDTPRCITDMLLQYGLRSATKSCKN